MRIALLTALLAATGCGPAFSGDCSPISNASTVAVTSEVRAEIAPIPMGGSIADGTYVRSATTHYTGIGGSTEAPTVTHRQTLAVSNGGTVLKSVDSKNGGADELLIFAIRVSGTALRTSLVCKLSGDISYAYE